MATTKKATAIKANKEIESRKALFETVLRNLNDATKVNGVVITKVGDIPRELLFVDEQFQGDRSHNRTVKLAEGWNWMKYDNITVVPHMETYQFSIVDGQNRFDASGMINIPSLPSKVICGLSDNPKERLKQEAELFVRQDEQIDMLKPVEKHKAKLIMGDKAAVTLDKILRKYKVDYKNHGGQRKASVLGSYARTLQVASQNGADGLEFIFSIIKNAGWDTEPNGYGSTQMVSMNLIYNAYDVNGERERIASYLSEKLRETTPDLLLANSRSKYPNRDRNAAMALYLDDMLVDAGVVERNFYAEEGVKGITTIKSSSRKTA